MNVIVVLLVWMIMAAILVTGVVLATYGTFWVLIVGFLLFILGMTKYGILTH